MNNLLSDYVVRKIHHLSDVQIRLIKRHAEYRAVFEKVYAALRQDADHAVIVLVGDIVHTKTELSPELVVMAHDFLATLAEIAPTVVIPGNHDASMGNRDRMDSLFPIVKGINSPNLHYVKNSAAFAVGNVQFSVMSIFDPHESYVSAQQLTVTPKIALYHGIVNNAATDLGYVFHNGDIDAKFFDGFDMVMLGDIHKMQQMQERDARNDKPEMWYCGSLIQQSHGESLQHGFLTWDVSTCKPTFHEIPNEYGYYTVTIRDGAVQPYDDIPKNARLRLQVWNTDESVIKRVLADVRKAANVHEVVVNQMDDKSIVHVGDMRSNTLDITNVKVQNEHIIRFLQRTDNITAEMGARIIALNTSLNAKLPPRESATNAEWSAGKFEFSNMFSYGPQNTVDFSKMRGTVGLFAPNATGKSSVLDSLTYTIFDKCSRAHLASQVMNQRGFSFECDFTFRLNDMNYHITRKGTRSKATNQVRVDVDFWYLNEFGERVSLNGEERRATNGNIRSYIGTYDDFFLTALSAQNAANGFIDISQSERKDLLSRFLGLNILDELHKLASDDAKELHTLLKDFARQDFTAQLACAESDRDTVTLQLKTIEENYTTLESSASDVDATILTLTRQLLPVDTTVLDINFLRKEEAESLRKEVATQQLVARLSAEIATVEAERQESMEALKSFDEPTLTRNHDHLALLEAEQLATAAKIETAKVDVRHKLAKLEKLREHKYDPNCTFCMNNVFVKDAIRTQAELEDDKVRVTALVNRAIELKTEITELQRFKELYTKLLAEKTRFEKLTLSKATLELNLTKSERSLDDIARSLIVVRQRIASYESQKEAIQHNESIEVQITKAQAELSEVQLRMRSVDKERQGAFGRLRVAETTVAHITESIVRARELEQEYDAFELYLKAVQRDGLPYELIGQTVPEIAREVNNILGQVVDFTISWELDGKDINAYLHYDENTRWPLELTSGMEKFISGVAIRVALLNVSSLPRPNFLAIDEGFGVLDAENINNLHAFLEYLKSQFTFILVISHLDSIKDCVDTAIDVKKNEDGFSVIDY